MTRCLDWRRAAVAAALVALAGVAPASADDAEPQARQALQAATWPADIVRLADDYMQRYPQSSWRIVAEGMKLGAADTMRALNRSEVTLYRSSFQPHADNGVADDLRHAAMGDKEAALRMALHAWRAERNEARYVGWLQLASTLGHEKATYELALHFRRNGQPALASQYETRALEMGFEPPVWLDHRRK